MSGISGFLKKAVYFAFYPFFRYWDDRFQEMNRRLHFQEALMSQQLHLLRGIEQRLEGLQQDILSEAHVVSETSLHLERTIREWESRKDEPAAPR